MIVRWKSLLPDNGYEQYIDGKWEEISKDQVQRAILLGEPMLWNPTDMSRFAIAEGKK